MKVRTEFLNVNTKKHSNPYIQGTIVPCDIIENLARLYDYNIIGGLAPARPIIPRQYFRLYGISNEVVGYLVLVTKYKM